jgi:hypothetical protein
VNAPGKRGLARRCRLPLIAASPLLWLGACAEPATLSDAVGAAPKPTLADPTHTLMPPAQIARAVGWQLAGTPGGSEGPEAPGPERRNLAWVIPRAQEGLPGADRITLVRLTAR